MTNEEYRASVVNHLSWIAALIFGTGLAISGWLSCICREIDRVHFSGPSFPRTIQVVPVQSDKYGHMKAAPVKVQIVTPEADDKFEERM